LSKERPPLFGERRQAFPRWARTKFRDAEGTVRRLLVLETILPALVVMIAAVLDFVASVYARLVLHIAALDALRVIVGGEGLAGVARRAARW
jgi:hypothetical protein